MSHKGTVHMDKDALSYQECAFSSVLAIEEEDKKWKYSKAIEACRGSFTRLVQSVDIAFGS